MKLETLALRGVLRFDELATLDLRDLPPGLIAFVGRNGEGKTASLEAPLACLFRQFPSREQEIFDYVTRSDGFIEVTFELEGRGLYRARLNLDRPHRKAEGVLVRILPDGTQAILNDGKVTSFDAEVRKILPPIELLLASVFAAQNRAGSFARIDRKRRKELFSSLLGLDHYELLSERSRSALSLVQQAIGPLTATRTVLERDADDQVARDLEQRAQRVQVESGEIEIRRADLSRVIHESEAELARLSDDAAAHNAAKQRVDRLEAELAVRRQERERVHAAVKAHREETTAERERQLLATDEAIAALTQNLHDGSAYEADVAQIVSERDAVIADADARIAKNHALQDQAAAIREADTRLQQINSELNTIHHEQRVAAEEVDGLRKRELVLIETLGAIGRAELDLQRATSDAALLGSVPCGGEGDYAACQFLTNAEAALARIPILKATIVPKDTTRVELQDAREGIRELATKAKEWQTRLRELEPERHTVHALAKLLPDVAAAEERIAGHEQRKHDAEADAARRTADAQARATARREDLQRRIDDTRAVHERQLVLFDARAQTRREDLHLQLQGLDQGILTGEAERHDASEALAQTADASTRWAEQSALLTLKRKEWDETTAALARTKAEHEDLARQVADVRARRMEIAALEARLTALKADAVDWQLLATAMGRDGLQVLEIDAAGPTVSAYCNDLLQTCFGSRFTVDLVTQEAKVTKGKDGSTHKDSFELKVFDALRGGEPRDLSDLSGGEQILVDEALKSAIALLVNARNQHPIRTCWRDETTGALDGENAPRYIEMLRRVQQLGGFHHILFVTHNPDAAAQADAQVVIEGGRLEVRLPPYVGHPVTEAA
jgi:exonuclease SbcC